MKLNKKEKSFTPKHKNWLHFAEEDLKAAILCVENEYALIPPALVLAQQSAEKALKGYLYYKEVKPIKTHDLVKLAIRCSKFDEDFTTLLNDAADLNPHISVSRYPDSRFMMPDLTSAKILVRKSEKFFLFITDKINE